MRTYKEYEVCKYTKWDEEGEALRNVWLEEPVFIPTDATPREVTQLLTDLEILPSSIGTVFVTPCEESWQLEDFGGKALLSLVEKVVAYHNFD